MVSIGRPEAAVDQSITRLNILDSNNGAIPSLAKQMAGMREEPIGWSTTYNGPWARMKLLELGLVREVKNAKGFEPRQPVTELTDLGRAVRSTLRALGQ